MICGHERTTPSSLIGLLRCYLSGFEVCSLYFCCCTFHLVLLVLDFLFWRCLIIANHYPWYIHPYPLLCGIFTQQMLQFQPLERVSTKDALHHPYITNTASQDEEEEEEEGEEGYKTPDSTQNSLPGRRGRRGGGRRGLQDTRLHTKQLPFLRFESSSGHL